MCIRCNEQLLTACDNLLASPLLTSNSVAHATITAARAHTLNALGRLEKNFLIEFGSSPLTVAEALSIFYSFKTALELCESLLIDKIATDPRPNMVELVDLAIDAVQKRHEAAEQGEEITDEEATARVVRERGF